MIILANSLSIQTSGLFDGINVIFGQVWPVLAIIAGLVLGVVLIRFAASAVRRLADQ